MLSCLSTLYFKSVSCSLTSDRISVWFDLTAGYTVADFCQSCPLLQWELLDRKCNAVFKYFPWNMIPIVCIAYYFYITLLSLRESYMRPNLVEAVLGFCMLFQGIFSLLLFTGRFMWVGFHFGSQIVYDVATCLLSHIITLTKQCFSARFHHLCTDVTSVLQLVQWVRNLA